MDGVVILRIGRTVERGEAERSDRKRPYPGCTGVVWVGYPSAATCSVIRVAREGELPFAIESLAERLALD
jgi:hypothetical protein